MLITISELENKFIKFIDGIYSENSEDPKNYLYPNMIDHRISKMTLLELLFYQKNRLNQGYASSAAGKFALSLDAYRGAILSLNIDANKLRNTQQVQNVIFLTYLKNTTRFNEWTSGSISDSDYLMDLAKILQRVPVPVETIGKFRNVSQGESFYAKNTSFELVEVDWCLSQLSMIRNSSTEVATTVDLSENSANSALNPIGNTISKGIRSFAYNGRYSPDRVTGDVRNPVGASFGYEIPGINVDIRDDVEIQSIVENRVQILYDFIEYGDNIVKKTSNEPISINVNAATSTVNKTKTLPKI